MENLRIIVLGILAFGLSELVGCGGGGGGSSSPTTELTPGTTVTDSVAAGSWKYYSVAIPPGAWHVAAQLEAITGEIDLLGAQGTKPNVDMYNNDTFDCYEWALAGDLVSCEIFNPVEGTVYFGTWGNTLISDTGHPGGDYTIVAYIQTAPAFAPSEQTDPTLQKIASIYRKHLRGGPITAFPDTYPESGIVEIQKGADSHRLYFGADAVSGVLSINHNGSWAHFQSWDEFEGALSNAN